MCRSDIIEAVNRVDSGNGVAILTDMFGGTPSNLAISCMSRPKVEVLAGINLPMLVKLAKVRETLPAGGYRHGSGGRSQIRHHRQPRTRRQKRIEAPKQPGVYRGSAGPRASGHHSSGIPTKRMPCTRRLPPARKVGSSENQAPFRATDSESWIKRKSLSCSS